MSLARYLARLGYGSRGTCEQLLRQRRVTTVAGEPLQDNAPIDHEAIRVDREPLDPPPGAVILLHKPLGYVCSTQDRPPLVYELLPPRFLLRRPVIAPVGRLDADTSGLLLLTDDGALNHRLTSPRSHLPKTYRVTLAEPLRGEEGEIFASGALLLRGETTPLQPAALVVVDPQTVEVTVVEGRYHQLRRMFAAVGNHVMSLHRTRVGPVALGALPIGTWRMLQLQEIASLMPHR